MTELATIPIVVILVAGIVAGVIDVWSYRVHNLVTLPLLVTGLCYHALTGGLAGLWFSILGALFGLSILLVPYLLGGMGGGDVKFLGGVGAWLGLPLVGYVVLAACLASGVYSLVVLAVHGRLPELATNLRILLFQIRAVGSHLGSEERVEQAVRGNDRPQRLVPFVAMVAVGLVAVVVWSLALRGY